MSIGIVSVRNKTTEEILHFHYIQIICKVLRSTLEAIQSPHHQNRGLEYPTLEFNIKTNFRLVRTKQRNSQVLTESNNRPEIEHNSEVDAGNKSLLITIRNRKAKQ